MSSHIVSNPNRTNKKQYQSGKKRMRSSTSSNDDIFTKRINSTNIFEFLNNIPTPPRVSVIERMNKASCSKDPRDENVSIDDFIQNINIKMETYRKNRVAQ